MQKLSLGPGQDPAGHKENRDYIGFRVVLAGYRLSGSMGLGKASQAMLQLCRVMQSMILAVYCGVQIQIQRTAVLSFAIPTTCKSRVCIAPGDLEAISNLRVQVLGVVSVVVFGSEQHRPCLPGTA